MTEVLVSLTLLRQEERQILDRLAEFGVRAQPVTIRETGRFLDEGSVRLVLVRNLSHRESRLVAGLWRAAGIPTLNRWDAIETCADKARQALLFRRFAVPQPETRVALDVEHVGKLGQAMGGRYVLKPTDGSWGRGVVRIDDQACLESWIGGVESVDAGRKGVPVIVQEFVEKGASDIRAVVVGSDPVVAFERVAEDWRTNTHRGAAVVPIEITDDIRGLCSRVVALLGQGFYGIDLFRRSTDGAMLVCEVNHNPDFARSAAIHGVDVAAALARHVVALLAGELKPDRPEGRSAWAGSR